MKNAFGTDYSHWQSVDEVDFHKDTDAGQTFVALKATEGATNVDPTFADRQARVRTVDKYTLVLFYHFFHPLEDPIAQAKHYVSTVGTLQDRESIALDLESTPGWDKISPQKAAEAALTWYTHVKMLLNVLQHRLWTYGSPGWLRGTFGKFLSTLSWTRFWVARYGVADPGDVSPWPKWDLWQNSEYGGPRKDLDLDQFNGEVAA